MTGPRASRRRAPPHNSAISPLAYWRDPYSAWLQILWGLNGRDHARQRAIIKRHFDEEFYRATYPDVEKRLIAPLRHYILKGWKEGRDPSPLFSTQDYLETYGDVRESGANPYAHFLSDGRAEGRVATVSRAFSGTSARPRVPLIVPPLPSRSAWEALPARRLAEGEAGVDVIVPVYKGLAYTAATLASVLAADNVIPVECLVVNDASPEPAVTDLLRELAAMGKIRLLENEENRGFVGSVNRGMAVHSGRDVVLLNSDTLVFDGWVDRLIAPLRSDTTIATVTALSNNATIASYPDTALDNAYELELGAEALDRLAASTNGSDVVDIPTGIGFCMAIRRDALTELGLFDEATFGFGYGEECDFCMRASKAGWRNVLATGVFVRHFGGTAFGPGAAERSEHAQERLVAKHPDYPSRVARHLKADPVLPARILLDAARLRESLGGVSVLFLSHTREGGIVTYLDNMRALLSAEGLDARAKQALILQTQGQGIVRVRPFGDASLPYLPNLSALNLERHKHMLGRLIETLDPELIVVNSFAGLGAASIGEIMDALASGGRPLWHVWHDHQPLCPRLTFLDAEGHYCGETDAARCVPCLAASPEPQDWVRIEAWRKMFKRYLDAVDVVSAPSEAAAERARRLAAPERVFVHPHPEPHLDAVAPLPRATRAGGVRHVLMVGAIGPHKGAHVIEAMVADIARRQLPLHLHIVGYTSIASLTDGKHITIHGRYDGDDAALKTIKAIKPDLAACLSIWPETYVYTLSMMFALGLPTMAFDLGAQGERVKAYARGAVFARRLSEDPVSLNDALAALDVDALWARPLEPSADHALALAPLFRPRPPVRSAPRAERGQETADRAPSESV